MLVFEKVTAKNFLSIGNFPLEFNLNSHKKTLIVGTNGSGKSSIGLDIICYALYGRAFRKINKPQLISSVNNSNMLVECFFSSGKTQYKIIRGMKPNIFEIWKDGILVNQESATKDYQNFLETNILKMNFKTFCQIVVLGSASFTPFMQLTTQQRREMVEDLLDLQIFTTMNTLLKDKVSTNKNKIQENKYDIDLVKTKIESAKSHNKEIKKIHETQAKDLENKIKIIEEEITLVEIDIKNLIVELENYQDNTKNQDKIKKKIQELSKLEATLSHKMNTIRNDSKFFECNDNCPTCKQVIDLDFKQTALLKSATKLDEIDTGLKQLNDQKRIFEEQLLEFATINDKIFQLNMKLKEHQSTLMHKVSTKNSLTQDLKKSVEKSKSIDKTQILLMEKELINFEQTKKDLLEEKETLSIVGTLLKDGGIKTKIIRQYIPIINKLINNYLQEMDFFVDFNLDETFTETIKSRHRDIFSYASFSEGEKSKIDIAIILAWRMIAKLRNSVATNLLILDEVFSGALDINAVESLGKIIDDLDSNIIIISHTQSMKEFINFNRVIEVRKEKGFSIMEEVV